MIDEKPDIVLNINKPIGWSSNDAVRYVKRIFPNFKVGHAGTLDPFADGVLLVCVGRATKRVSELMDSEKEYEADIYLGSETDTLDVSGNIVKTCDLVELDEDLLRKTSEHFTGIIEQIPPDFSALKVNGRRSYEIVRNGGKVELEKRKITIYKLNLKQISTAHVKMQVTCSKGTYIRTLAQDICNYLNTCGYLQKLTRVRIGDFALTSATEINDVNNYLHKNSF